MKTDRRSILLKACVIAAGAPIAFFASNSGARPYAESYKLQPASPQRYKVFQQYGDIGGVLGFALFEGADDGDQDARSAITNLLSALGPVNEGELKALVGRQISQAQFYGDWYDTHDGSLIRLGDYQTSDGRVLSNPKLSSLNGVKIISGGSPGVVPGEGGQFAYAFQNPPYSLQASPEKIESLFDSIRDTILPTGFDCVITDWTSPKLQDVSDYFKAGMEWWGIFLFSIYVPEKHQLTIIAGSATD